MCDVRTVEASHKIISQPTDSIRNEFQNICLKSMHDYLLAAPNIYLYCKSMYVCCLCQQRLSYQNTRATLTCISFREDFRNWLCASTADVVTMERLVESYNWASHTHPRIHPYIYPLVPLVVHESMNHTKSHIYYSYSNKLTGTPVLRTIQMYYSPFKNRVRMFSWSIVRNRTFVHVHAWAVLCINRC